MVANHESVGRGIGMRNASTNFLWHQYGHVKSLNPKIDILKMVGRGVMQTSKSEVGEKKCN